VSRREGAPVAAVSAPPADATEAGMANSCPSSMRRTSVMSLAAARLAIDTPYSRAIPYKVSPAWTTWTTGVGVLFGVGVASGVGVGVLVGVRVLVAVGVGVEVGAGVGVPVWVGVAVGVGLGVRVSVGAGVGVSVGNAVRVAMTAAWTVAPISGVGCPPHALRIRLNRIKGTKTCFILPTHLLLPATASASIYHSSAALST
jgi:hypothetical protein